MSLGHKFETIISISNVTHNDSNSNETYRYFTYEITVQLLKQIMRTVCDGVGCIILAEDGHLWQSSAKTVVIF